MPVLKLLATRCQMVNEKISDGMARRNELLAEVQIVEVLSVLNYPDK